MSRGREASEDIRRHDKEHLHYLKVLQHYHYPFQSEIRRAIDWAVKVLSDMVEAGK